MLIEYKVMVDENDCIKIAHALGTLEAISKYYNQDFGDVVKDLEELQEKLSYSNRIKE